MLKWSLEDELAQDNEAENKLAVLVLSWLQATIVAPKCLKVRKCVNASASE